MWLLRDGPARRSGVHVDSALTSLDDFHVRRGLGKADVARGASPPVEKRSSTVEAAEPMEPSAFSRRASVLTQRPA
ncbi:hypothetical protein [Nonomuraea sp. NPDC049646]|uniref:hypothetical protein n=1 Tax=unclassified Nonomuraea TaxID=2593643 RepID=UPI00379FFF7A